MKCKQAICTICIGDGIIEELGKLTIPYMKNYAKKVNSEFICWTKGIYDKYPHYQKFEINTLINDGYNRVLYLDIDILVKNNAKNIFEIVPYNSLGMKKESREHPHAPKKSFKRYCIEYDKSLLRHNKNVETINWNGDYYNSGVILCSNNTNIFKKRPVEEINLFGIKDQHCINRYICLYKQKMFDIGDSFNSTCSFGREKIHYDSNKNCSFIHFIGKQEKSLATCLNYLKLSENCNE